MLWYFLAVLASAQNGPQTRQLWPLTICEEIHVQSLCRGYHLEFEAEGGALPSMCLWDAKDKKCSVLELEEGESAEAVSEICGQYLKARDCKTDARCDWQVNDFECAESRMAMKIPYTRINDRVYPPYNFDSILPPGPLDSQLQVISDQTHPFVPVVSTCKSQRNGQSCYGFSRDGDLCIWDAAKNSCNRFNGDQGETGRYLFEVCVQYTDPQCGHDLRCIYDIEERVCEDKEFQSIPWANRNDPVYPPYDPRWIQTPKPSDIQTTTIFVPPAAVTEAPTTMTDAPFTPFSNPQVSPFSNNQLAGPSIARTTHSPTDVYSAVVMFPRWPAFVCSDIVKEQMCRGLSKLNTDHICLWNAERLVCTGMPINNNKAVCDQYSVPTPCKSDQRCEWETHDVLCVPTATANEIGIGYRNDIVYPPYMETSFVHEKKYRGATQNLKPQDVLMWQMLNNQHQQQQYYPQQYGYGNMMGGMGYQQQLGYPQTPMMPQGMHMMTPGSNPVPQIPNSVGPNAVGHKMYAGQGFDVLSDCGDAKFKTQCRGFAADGVRMCLWNAPNQVCKADKLDEFDEICAQHATTVGCGLDARCNWDTNDLECLEGSNPEKIPYSRTLMAVYPPYDPQTVYADSSLPSSVSSQTGTKASSGDCKCLGTPDDLGYGAQCTPNPVSGDTRQYCTVAQGMCGDEMKASDGSNNWYSFQACQPATGEESEPKLRGSKPEETTSTRHKTNFWVPVIVGISVFVVASILTVAWCKKKPPTLREMINMDYIAHTDDYSAYQESHSPRI